MCRNGPASRSVTSTPSGICSLARLLGANSLAGFWRHWNPIWGYGLGRWVFPRLRVVVPSALAIVLTFAVSGFLHDLVIMAIRAEFALVFTPWFAFIGCAVILSERFRWKFTKRSWGIRATINLSHIVVCFGLSLLATAGSGIGW